MLLAGYSGFVRRIGSVMGICAVFVVGFGRLSLAQEPNDKTPPRTLCDTCAAELAAKKDTGTNQSEKGTETSQFEKGTETSQPELDCPLCGKVKLDPKCEEVICQSCAAAEMQCRRCLLALGWPEHLDTVEPLHNRIYFVSDRDDENELFSMAPDGSDLKQLTNNEFTDSEPRVSFDGRWVAFVSFRSGRWDLYIVDAHGAHERRLTNSEFLEAAPTWFPDGKKLAITVCKDTMGGKGEPPRTLHTIQRDGQALTELKIDTPLVSCWWPDVSPDGNAIVFAHYMKKGAPEEIFMRSGLGEITKLVAGRDSYQPRYSPGGKKVAFASSRTKNFELYIMNADGTRQQRMTKNKYHDSQPCWSPDGTKLAFVRIVGDNNQEIFVMNVADYSKTNVTNHTRVDTMPCWR